MEEKIDQCVAMCEHEHHEHGGVGGADLLSEEEAAVEWSLYSRIDRDAFTCLNEARDGSGLSVFKPYASRADRAAFVDSDADEELLFNVPFTGNVKLKGILLRGYLYSRSLPLFL